MQSPARVALFTALTALVGCGPNYRYVYDGESAFERCYGLDYDAAIADSARVSCWSAWLQSYAYGANPDRVDFARNRLAALGSDARRAPAPASSGAPAPGTPAPTAALAVDTDRTGNRPSPTAAPTVSPWRDRISTGGNPVSAPPPTAQDSTGADPPGASCARDCRAAWSTCSARCPRQDAACVAHCDEAYRDCMRGCF